MCMPCSTDCVFSPNEQVIMTGTSVKKGQVKTDVRDQGDSPHPLAYIENTNNILALLRLFVMLMIISLMYEDCMHGLMCCKQATFYYNYSAVYSHVCFCLRVRGS